MKTDRPQYFAVPDPLDPAKASFWYRVKTGRNAGLIEPWPPRRSRWGALLVKDVPHDRRTERAAYRAFVNAHFAKVREARANARAAIDADPDGAAARFACWQIRC